MGQRISLACEKCGRTCYIRKDAQIDQKAFAGFHECAGRYFKL